MAVYESLYTGQQVDNAVLRALPLDTTTATDVTIESVTYHTLWKVAPTSSNQVYGVAIHPTNGRLYRIYNNRGAYSAYAYDTDTTTDTKVTQTVTTENAELPLLVKNTNSVTTTTDSAKFSANVKLNPSTGRLTVNSIDAASGAVDNIDIDDATIGNIAVTGAANFANTITGSISGNAATANKVNNQLTINVNGSPYKYDGSAAQSINISIPSVTGYVSGPSSSTDNGIPRFDGTTGKILQNSSAVISDSGDLTVENTSGGDISLILKRASNTAWTQKVSGGNFSISAAGTNLALWHESSQGSDLNIYGPVNIGTSAANKNVKVYGNIDGNNITGASINAGSITADSGIIGNLNVTGAASFTNTINGSIAGNAATATTASKVANKLNFNNGGTTTSYDGSATVNITIPVTSSFVSGPSSATDNALARFNGTDGKVIQNSSATLDDSGKLSIPSISVSGAATFTSTITGSISGNAATATSAGKVNNKLTINVNGTATEFDGSAAKSVNISIPSVTGYISGPSSSTDNGIVRFDGTSGKLVQDSKWYMDDGGNVVFKGTKANSALIKPVDNTGDANGNGIKIGGGGTVIVGAGESTETFSTAGGDENLHLAADAAVYIYTNRDSGASSGKTFTFDTSGNEIIPARLYFGSTSGFSLSSSGTSYLQVLYGSGGAGKMMMGGLGVASNYSQSSNIPSNGIYTEGGIKIGSSVTITSVKNATTATHSGWTAAATDQAILVNNNMLSYWTGAYNSSNNSNLQYCKDGIILGSNSAKAEGNRAANMLVKAAVQGQLNSSKYAITEYSTTATANTVKATMQYNSTTDCIEFVFA